MVEVLAREMIGKMKKVINQIYPGARRRYGVQDFDLIPLFGPELVPVAVCRKAIELLFVV
jgi:hypothetical protein